MTKNNCLTGFILSREYNPSCKCVNYNSDWKHEENVCPCGFSITVDGDNILNYVCETDNIAWNVMAPYCDECRFRSGKIAEMLPFQFDFDSSGVDAANGVVVHLWQHITDGRQHAVNAN